MPTVLKTILSPADNDGGFVLVCGVAELNSSGLEHDDTRYAVARYGHLDEPGQPRADLLEMVTMPRPPSRSEFRRHTRGAKGQLDLAESGQHGPGYSKHYRDNYERFSYAAEMAMTERVWLPHDVATSRQQRVFVAISLGDQSHVVLRYLDCRTGDVLFEEKLKTQSLGLANDANRVWCSVRGKILLSNDGQRLLVRNFKETTRSPKAFFEERAVESGLPVMARSEFLPVVIDGHVAQTDNSWIACEELTSKGALLKIIEKGSLKTKSEIKLSGAPISLAAAPEGNVAVCGFIGGSVWVVDLVTEKIRKFKPHIGATRDHWAEVRIADNEEFFVSECDSKLVLTRLSDGVSAEVHTLEVTRLETEPYKSVDTSVLIWPTFSVLGNRVGVSENRSIRELDTNPDQFEHHFVSETGRPGARKPVKVSRKAPLEESIEKARLGQHAEQIIKLHSPAFKISTKKLGKRGWAQPGVAHAPELGVSRFGGWPDLPEDLAWPTWRGRPMSFLGQIALAEAQEIQRNPLLPADGMLSFFLGCSSEQYDCDDDPRKRFMVELLFDLEPGEANGWQVIYTSAGVPLRRLVYEQEPIPELHRPSLLRFKNGGKSLPDESGAAMECMNLDAQRRADYFEMIGQLQSANWEHQFMGYASLIQMTPPEYYCEARGYSWPTESDQEYAEFLESASDWVLLLQFASDEVFNWGDGGHFYYCVRRSALLELDFSDARIFFEN